MKPFKSYELKIKSRSLALEGQLIHQNESKLKRQIERCKAKIAELNSMPPLEVTTADLNFIKECEATLARLRADRDSLRHHRKDIVRPFTRTAMLAYGFLKGRAYKEMERKRYTDPDWDALAKTIERHGSRAGILQDRMQAFAQWKAEAGVPDVHTNTPRKQRMKEAA